MQTLFDEMAKAGNTLPFDQEFFEGAYHLTFGMPAPPDIDEDIKEFFRYRNSNKDKQSIEAQIKLGFNFDDLFAAKAEPFANFLTKGMQTKLELLLWDQFSKVLIEIYVETVRYPRHFGYFVL